MLRDLRDHLLPYPLCKHRRNRIVAQCLYMKFSAESIPVVEPPRPVCERCGAGSEPFSLTSSNASPTTSPRIFRCHCFNASSAPDIIPLTAVGLDFPIHLKTTTEFTCIVEHR